MRHKDQSYHEFDTRGGATGRLTRIAGEVVQKETSFDTILEYDDNHAPPRLTRIWAGGRSLEFVYGGPGGPDKLWKIVDPAETAEIYGSTLTDRVIEFDYCGGSRLCEITDQLDYTIEIDFDANGRITSLSDKMTAVEANSSAAAHT